MSVSADLPVETRPAGDVAAEAARKRGPGRPGAPAEPPPFKWKLIGYSAGVPVTLIKSIEREEVDAQLQRLQQEGYYRNLAVVSIDEAPLKPLHVPGIVVVKTKPQGSVAAKKPAKKDASVSKPAPKAGKKSVNKRKR